MYSYGQLTSPRDDDPRFKTEDEAITAAEDASQESALDPILGVWEDETGELLHIVYQGAVYSA
jgi:hypothetical protein